MRQEILPSLGLPQRSADWPARYHRPSKRPPPLGSSQRSDDWSARHRQSIAALAILVLASCLMEPSAPAFAQGVPEHEVAQARQFDQQFAGPFRQLYKIELHFMRIVCQPTKKQFEKIALDGEPTLKATIRKFAKIMNRPIDNQQSDPRTLIANALAESVQFNSLA